jgi:hypothetical protein
MTDLLLDHGEPQDELVAGLARLRRRGTLVATERWLLLIGGTLLPVGVFLVVAGWYGAAHTTRVFEEIPYLISGGLFGLTLVVIGAAFYFGYWLTRLVGGERQTLDVLLRIEERLISIEAGGRSLAPVAPGPGLVATKTGTMVHRPDCQVVAGRPAGELRAVRLPATGMTSCKLCSPLAEGAGVTVTV